MDGRRDLRIRRGCRGIPPARDRELLTRARRCAAAAPIRKGEGALGRLAISAEPVQIHDISDERMYQSRVRDLLIRSGYRSLTRRAAPARATACSAGSSVDRNVPGAFLPRWSSCCKTFADPVGAGDPERPAVPRDRAEGPRARGGEPAQERVPRQHVARIAHAAQRDHRLLGGAAERMFGDVNEKQAEYLRDILESGRHLLIADQRHPRPVEDRGGADGARRVRVRAAADDRQRAGPRARAGDAARHRARRARSASAWARSAPTSAR